MTQLDAARLSDTFVTASLGVFSLALVAYAVAAAVARSRHPGCAFTRFVLHRPSPGLPGGAIHPPA